MGRGPVSRDAFARGATPAASLHVLAKDRFKEKAERLAAKKGASAQRDAYARPAKPPAAKPDAFRGTVEAPPAPVREAAFRPGPPRKVRTLANGASLTVVASQPQSAEAEVLKRAEKKPRAAMSSTFVLVSSASLVEAPASVAASDCGQGPLAIPPLSSPKFKPTGGGGGSGGGSGGATPPSDRIFNQDDLAGVLIVLAILLLLALYLVSLFRGNIAGATDEAVLNVQSASAAPAAPPAPPPDPFGNQAVDLTPKSPPPPEAPVVAAAPAAAPAPVAEPAAIDVRAYAYFCTDRSELTPASAEALDREMAVWGDRMAGKDLVVAGYADTRGEAVYNTWLGGERAKAVVNYLTAKGFKATALAVGELPDLEDNRNCANQRRVDILLADAPSEPSRSCAPPPELAALACLVEQRKLSASSEPEPAP